MIAALGVCLVVLGAWASVTDVRRRVIPNLCCVLVATCGLVLQVARAFWEVFAGSVPPPALCLVTAAGVAVVGASAELIARRVAGRAFVGLGDVKYVAAWACMLGPLVFYGLVVACLAGAACAIARRRRTFPMAPWLTVAFFVVGAAALI